MVKTQKIEFLQENVIFAFLVKNLPVEWKKIR